MKNKNIILFSSGVSEQNGTLGHIMGALSQKGYCCSNWRALFANANDENYIALLPMLIKKIPTFDYAVLICEGHDLTTIYRDHGTEQVKTMRDNVLFEIGLCSMALGLSRTILITDEDVRMPDDLIGVNKTLAVKRIKLPAGARAAQADGAEDIARQIDEHIRLTGDTLHQVVIGAACSTACGYVSNFISRVLEHIDDNILIAADGRTEVRRVPLDKVYVHIILLEDINEATEEKVSRIKSGLSKGTIPTARSRPVDFDCYFEDGAMHIVDYPTNIVTSYDTARMILEMEADDMLDLNAQKRFVGKELNLYESTLHSILNRKHLERSIQHFYAFLPEKERARIVDQVAEVVENRLTIVRMNL